MFQRWTPKRGPLTRPRSSEDSLPVDDLPFVQEDWPNPAGPRPLVEGLWVQNPLTTTLAATAAPFEQTEWPLPSWSRVFSVELLTWVNELLPVLENAGEKPFAQFDWPLAQARTDRLGWTQSPTPATPQAPFYQTDWPLPQQGRADRLSWSQSPQPPAAPKPFSQLEWPNPRGRPPVADWSSALLPALEKAGLKPFLQSEWLNPAALPKITDDGRWVQWLLGTTLVVAARPFAQVDWPLPRVTRVSVDSLSWTQSPPVPQQQAAALPRAPTFAPGARSYTQQPFDAPNLVINTAVVVQQSVPRTAFFVPRYILQQQQPDSWPNLVINTTPTPEPEAVRDLGVRWPPLGKSRYWDEEQKIVNEYLDRVEAAAQKAKAYKVVMAAQTARGDVLEDPRNALAELVGVLAKSRIQRRLAEQLARLEERARLELDAIVEDDDEEVITALLSKPLH